MSKAGLRFFDANPNADSDRSHQLLVTCVSSEEDAHQFAHHDGDVYNQPAGPLVDPWGKFVNNAE